MAENVLRTVNFILRTVKNVLRTVRNVLRKVRNVLSKVKNVLQPVIFVSLPVKSTLLMKIFQKKKQRRLGKAGTIDVHYFPDQLAGL